MTEEEKKEFHTKYEEKCVNKLRKRGYLFNLRKITKVDLSNQLIIKSIECDDSLTITGNDWITIEILVLYYHYSFIQDSHEHRK